MRHELETYQSFGSTFDLKKKMPSRGKGGSGGGGSAKSDIQKCLRCSIILHANDAAKHDVDCSAANAVFVAQDGGASDDISSSSLAYVGATPNKSSDARILLDDSILSVCASPHRASDGVDVTPHRASDGADVTPHRASDDVTPGDSSIASGKKTGTCHLLDASCMNTSTTSSLTYGFVDVGISPSHLHFLHFIFSLKFCLHPFCLYLSFSSFVTVKSG